MANGLDAIDWRKLALLRLLFSVIAILMMIGLISYVVHYNETLRSKPCDLAEKQGFVCLPNPKQYSNCFQNGTVWLCSRSGTGHSYLEEAQINMLKAAENLK